MQCKNINVFRFDRYSQVGFTTFTETANALQLQPEEILTGRRRDKLRWSKSEVSQSEQLRSQKATTTR